MGNSPKAIEKANDEIRTHSPHLILSSTFLRFPSKLERQYFIPNEVLKCKVQPRTINISLSQCPDNGSSLGALQR